MDGTKEHSEVDSPPPARRIETLETRHGLQPTSDGLQTSSVHAPSSDGLQPRSPNRPPRARSHQSVPSGRDDRRLRSAMGCCGSAVQTIYSVPEGVAGTANGSGGTDFFGTANVVRVLIKGWAIW